MVGVRLPARAQALRPTSLRPQAVVLVEAGALPSARQAPSLSVANPFAALFPPGYERQLLQASGELFSVPFSVQPLLPRARPARPGHRAGRPQVGLQATVEHRSPSTFRVSCVADSS